MSGQAELIAKLQEQNGLYKQIFEGASSIDDALANAARAGFTVTAAELGAAVLKIRGPKVLELNDEDLEQVAGGQIDLKNIALCTCYGA